ncbi:hypothetical protein F2S71_22595 [Pseudomonas syringae pv. actinidiae]|nr:hypothetical protein [Pseudomonas syringae pv. actinidiae]
MLTDASAVQGLPIDMIHLIDGKDHPDLEMPVYGAASKKIMSIYCPSTSRQTGHLLLPERQVLRVF